MTDDRDGMTVGEAGTPRANGIVRWLENARPAIQTTQRQLLLVALGYLVTRLVLIRELRVAGDKYSLDVYDYHAWALTMVRMHHLPTDAGWQYPVGAALLFLLSNLVPAQFSTVFSLLMFMCDLGITVTLTVVAVRGGRFRGVWLWLVLVPLLGPIVLDRFDLAPTLAVVAALAVMSPRGRQALFGMLLGAGVLLKVWPVLGGLACGTRHSLARTLAWCVTTAVVVTAISAIFLGNTFGFISNQSTRGLETEAIVGTPWFLREAFTQTAIPTHFSSGALEISGALASDLASGLRGVMFVLAAGLAFWWFAQTRHGRSVSIVRGRDTVFMATLWYIIVSPVLSPQYLIWLIGLGAICLCSPESVMKRPVEVIAVTVVMTRVMLEEPAQLYGGPATVSLHPTTAVALLFAARNVLLLLAAFDAACLLLRRETRGRRVVNGAQSPAEHATRTLDASA
jgi:hypothetical protein